MVILFSTLTILSLLVVAIFAHATGMAATNYFVLIAALSGYLLWQGHKQYALLSAEQGK